MLGAILLIRTEEAKQGRQQPYGGNQIRSGRMQIRQRGKKRQKSGTYEARTYA